jgi:hypothetical protein
MINSEFFVPNKSFHQLKFLIFKPIISRMTSTLSVVLLVVSFLIISTSNSFDFTQKILSFGPRPSFGKETGRKQTRDYIISTLKKFNFTIILETHKENTPFGVVEFTNIIANYKQQLNKKKLILAAHYESKFYKDLKFVGATDAAFPCGLVLELASFIDQQIQSRNWNDPSVDFQLVFFDGEEAFIGFSEKDGLYGSKFIASKWEKEVNYISKLTNKRENLPTLKCWFCLTCWATEIQIFTVIDIIDSRGLKINI